MKQTKIFPFLAAFALFFAACNNVDEPTPPPTGGDKTLPYTETFESDFGDFTTVNVSGEQTWEIDSYGYAKISGYLNDTQENVANEDWLVSPKIVMSGAQIKMSFESVVRYAGTVSEEIFVMVSEDYAGDVTTATWTQLPIEFNNSSTWNLKLVQHNMSAYTGKTITVAFKYLSTDAKAGTWEVKNFTIEEGAIEPEVIEDQNLPYEEPLSEEFGNFTTFSVSGDQEWEIDSYGYAKMSGYINDTGENLANEDWLISPRIIMTADVKIKMSFNSVVRYTGNVDEEIFVMVSEDYAGDVTTATWTQLPITFENAGNWNLSLVEHDMSAYAGKTITVAFKYISTDNKAGTWEVNNFTMKEGEIIVIGPDDKGGVNNPFTVDEVLEKDPQSTETPDDGCSDVYVSGTIFGVWDTNSKAVITENIDASDKNMTYNMVLGTSDAYICIQLPAGDIRDNYNLADHPEHIGKTIKVKGDILKYNSMPGVKNLTEAEIVE